MRLVIDFGEPVLREDVILAIQPNDLDDFYVAASDFDKSNLFFVLLTSLHQFEERGDARRAAHLSFLIAYYLFVTLTPPGSFYLARHYINKALSFDPISEYEEWRVLIEKGN